MEVINKYMEYGGCLHFELGMSITDGYFKKYNNQRIDVDSGRSALQYIIENYNFKRIWLPVYNCPLVGKRISEVGDIEIKWYNLENDFSPQISNERFCVGDALLWVNYCGIMPASLIDKVANMQKEIPVKIIIDNIQAYFSEPRMDVLNIYSCRKFLGVPDGGHIIGNDIKIKELLRYSTADNYLYLLKAIETGSNSVYGDYQISEKRFSEANIVYGMPLLTERVLSNINYENVIARRKANFIELHLRLQDSNRLIIDTSTITPSVYPYLTSDGELREKLLDNSIYISRFWKHVLTNEFSNLFERDLAEYLIPLPIDQRYNIEDMDYIADKVIELLRA